MERSTYTLKRLSRFFSPKLFCMKLFIVQLYLLGDLQIAISQSPYDLLQSIADTYTKQASISFSVDLKYYELGQNIPIHTLQMQVAKRGSSYYSKFDRFEQYMGKTALLEVDHNSKEIYLSETGKHQKLPGAVDISRLKSIATEYGLQLHTFDPGNGLCGLRFEAPQASQTRIDIIFDEAYRIVRTETIIKVDPALYSNELNNKKITAEFKYWPTDDHLIVPPLKQFVVKRGSQFLPASTYKGFTIIR